MYGVIEGPKTYGMSAAWTTVLRDVKSCFWQVFGKGWRKIRLTAFIRRRRNLFRKRRVPSVYLQTFQSANLPIVSAVHVSWDKQLTSPSWRILGHIPNKSTTRAALEEIGSDFCGAFPFGTAYAVNVRVLGERIEN